MPLPRGVEPAMLEACEAEEGGYETHRQTGRCDPAGAGLREDKVARMEAAHIQTGRKKFDSSVTCPSEGQSSNRRYAHFSYYSPL